MTRCIMRRIEQRSKRLHIFHFEYLSILAGIPVGGKCSVCLICMKYMIIILIKVSIAVRIGGASDSQLCRK